MTPEETMKRVRLDDIPGQLRQMADDIDAGTFGPSSLIVIAPPNGDDGAWPRVFGWGAVLSDMELVGLCEMAKGFFVAHRTIRAR